GDVAALAPAAEVAVQGDPQSWGGELVVAGPGDQAGGFAGAGGLVSAQGGGFSVAGGLGDGLGAADEGAPLGPAGGPLGIPDRQAGGEQADRDGQPHLSHHEVPEELADGEPRPWRAEAENAGPRTARSAGAQRCAAAGPPRGRSRPARRRCRRVRRGGSATRASGAAAGSPPGPA